MYAADRDNPWVRDRVAAHWRWRAWFAAAAAAVFAIVVLEVFRKWAAVLQQSFATAFHQAPGVWPDLLATSALQCLIFGLFLVAAMVATWVEGRRPWRREPGGGQALVGGLAIGSGGFGAAVAIAAMAGAVIAGPASSEPTPLGPIAFWALIIALQSFAEEAFFRGWLQPVLSADWGPWPGLLVASAMFAALHLFAGVQKPFQDPLTLVNLFMGGMLFGALAMRTGNLIAPTAAHFAWNWTESGVSGLNGDPTGSLLNLRFAGSPLWNGGDDTMNGSLATTLVLVALVAVVLLVRKSRAMAPAAA